MKKLLLSLVILTAGGAAHAQWTEQATGFTTVSRGVSEIRVVDANTVWCLGYDGTAPTNNIQEFTRTSDGGATWVAGIIDVGDETQEITNLAPVNATTCFAGYVSPTDGLGGLVRTTDGGQTWAFPGNFITLSPTPYQTNGALASFFNVVHVFGDGQTVVTEGDPIGAGVGEFECYRSTDGGETWALVPAAALPNPASGEYGYNGGNVGVGDAFWFVTNKGKLYRTLDKGVTWTKLNTPITDFSGTAIGGQIFFSNANNGILIKRATAGTVNTYTLYKTSDGGSTWDAGAAYTAPYRSLSYIPGSNVLVGVGGNSVATYASAYSTDNGTTWTVIDTGVQRTSIGFANGSTGWAGGFNQDDTVGGIYKYTGAALGLPTVGPKAMFSATPNPTTGIINVASETVAISDVTVFDLLGKQVYNKKFSAMNQASIDLSSLNTGSYIMKATSDTGATQTIKILKN